MKYILAAVFTSSLMLGGCSKAPTGSTQVVPTKGAPPEGAPIPTRLSSASHDVVLELLDKNGIPWFQKDDGELSFSTGSPHLDVEIKYRDSAPTGISIRLDDSSSEFDAEIVSADDMLINADGTFVLEFGKLHPYVPPVNESEMFSPF